MPGVIMENGGAAARTNHDREAMSNAANGASNRPLEKAGWTELQRSQNQASQANGVNGMRAAQSADSLADSIPKDLRNQMNQLPPEINHITEGFESLPNLLTRLAQVTHNQLSAKILELAGLNVQTSADTGSNFMADDNSAENIKKKVNLLKFTESMHSNWTKALVITQWSRVSEEVGKVIDLKAHLDEQRLYYDIAVHELSELKRSLVHARLPNPDLRTAVEVLSTGKASWMPDLGYIEPPPLTAKEILQSLQNLNTLLSIRLNLHDYDNIPYHFRNYTIKSGRVTFRVEGEFEVDLTIADEDPEKQFWFIDFRFLFTPSVSSLADHMRFALESKINAILEKDGLAGCYHFLHELALTHKISELRRQAYELARSRWIDTLKVESLHRALSIQYWVDRYGKDGPKSWIILGVVSGKKKGRMHDEKETSRIGIRWFRDSKEVKDVEIPLELTNLSAEELLRSVINIHVAHILESMYKNLRTKPLFANRDLALSFRRSTEDVGEPELRVHLTSQYEIGVLIEFISGKFAISPASRLTSQAETRLNSQTVDPASNGHGFIENLHCVLVSEDTVSRAFTVGWLPVRNPGLPQDELKPFLPRDTLQLSWFRRPGWNPDWFLAFSSNMSGESWWLIEITNVPQGPGTDKTIESQGPKVRSHIQIPLKSVSPTPTYAFLSSLHIFAACLISYYTNMRSLHARRSKSVLQSSPKKAKSGPLNHPSLYVLLSTILPSKNKSSRTGKPWAKDILKITFQGLEKPKAKEMPTDTGDTTLPSPPISQNVPTQALPADMRPQDAGQEAVMIAEGHMEAAMPAGLLVKQHVDKDIAFHPSTGAFAFRLQAKVGEPAIDPLIERLQRVERLVDFVQVINSHPNTLHCESVSLSRLIFSYVYPQILGPNQPPKDSPRYRATIDFWSTTSSPEIQLEAGNPHIRILDCLTKILSSSLGLSGLGSLLPLTLPVLRALDTAEAAWSALNTSSELQIFCRAADWYSMRYAIVSPPTDSQEAHTSLPDAPNRISFEIRLFRRGDAPWWCMRRERPHGSPPVDRMDLMLKRAIWDGGEKDVWMGMKCAAIAQMGGAEAMIARLDEVMREVATDARVFEEVGFGATRVEVETIGNDELRGQDIGQGQSPPQVQPQMQMQPQSQPKPQPKAQSKAQPVANAQPPRPQSQSPVLQKQKQGQPPPGSRAALVANAQARGQLQAQQIAAMEARQGFGLADVKAMQEAQEQARRAAKQGKGKAGKAGGGQGKSNTGGGGGGGSGTGTGKQDTIVID